MTRRYHFLRKLIKCAHVQLRAYSNRAAKIIVRDPMAHSSEALNTLDWLPLCSRRGYHKLKLVYKCINSMAPQYLSKFFQNRQRHIHSYSTRNNDLIRIPVFKQNFGKRTFRVSGVNLFNGLPKNTRTALSFASFLNLCKIFLTNSYVIFWYFWYLTVVCMLVFLEFCN